MVTLVQSPQLSGQLVPIQQLHQFIAELEAELGPIEQVRREETLDGLRKQAGCQSAQTVATPASPTQTTLLQVRTAPAFSAANSESHQSNPAEEKEVGSQTNETGQDANAIEWQQVWSKNCKRYYFFNIKTGDSCWKDPATNKRPFIVHEDKQAVSKKQKHDATVVKQKPKLAVCSAEEQNGANAPGDVWQKTWSKSNKRFYWFNRKTSESKWEEPVTVAITVPEFT